MDEDEDLWQSLGEFFSDAVSMLLLGSVPPAMTAYARRGLPEFSGADLRHRPGSSEAGREILEHQDRRNAARAQWAYENFLFRFNQIMMVLDGLLSITGEVASLGPQVAGLARSLGSRARVLNRAAAVVAEAGSDLASGAADSLPAAARRAMAAGTPRRPSVVRSIDQTLMGLRDDATALTRRVRQAEAAAGRTLSPQQFGSVNDAVFKAHVLQAIEDGQLPATLRVSPTFNQPGRGGIDVWDSATGIGWDLTTATSRQVAGHDRYLGQVMPDGTVITDVRPLVYSR